MVAGPCRDMRQGRPGRRRHRHVGARRQERPHRGVVPELYGEEQRRLAGRGRRIGAGAVRDERLDDRYMILRRRPHDRGLCLPRIGDVGVRAPSQQQLHGLHAPGAGAGQERRLARRHQSGVGAGLEQLLHQGRVRVDAGERQRGGAVGVEAVDVGAGGDEAGRHLGVVAIRGPVQRGRAVRLGGVDRYARPQQVFDAGQIAVARRIGQSGVGAASAQRSQGEERREPSASEASKRHVSWPVPGRHPWLKRFKTRRVTSLVPEGSDLIKRYQRSLRQGLWSNKGQSCRARSQPAGLIGPGRSPWRCGRVYAHVRSVISAPRDDQCQTRTLSPTATRTAARTGCPCRGEA